MPYAIRSCLIASDFCIFLIPFDKNIKSSLKHAISFCWASEDAMKNLAINMQSNLLLRGQLSHPTSHGKPENPGHGSPENGGPFSSNIF